MTEPTERTEVERARDELAKAEFQLIEKGPFSAWWDWERPARGIVEGDDRVALYVYHPRHEGDGEFRADLSGPFRRLPAVLAALDGKVVAVEDAMAAFDALGDWLLGEIGLTSSEWEQQRGAFASRLTTKP